MGTKKDWLKTRDNLRKHLRRSRHLSDGAFRLWDELATGWAWTSPNCFPTQKQLCKTLGNHRNTISKWMNELVASGLILRQRRLRGYYYSIVTELPSKFLDHNPNNVFAQDDHKSFNDPMHNSVCNGGKSQEPNVHTIVHANAQQRVHENHSHVHKTVHVDAQQVVHVMKHSKKKHSKKFETQEPEMSESEFRSFPDAEGKSESTRASREHEDNGTGEKMTEEINDLIEDPWEDGHKSPKFRPKQRTADLLGSGRAGMPFPEAVSGSQSLDLEKQEADIESPFIETPEGVYARLRGEICDKWGERSLRTLPNQIPTVKLTNQVKSAILKTYEPDVIRDMIRVLVWDWEVARSECFPPRVGQQYPCLRSLVQYHASLVARIESGFDYPTSQRGAVNKYHSLFVRKQARVVDDDPF